MANRNNSALFSKNSNVTVHIAVRYTLSPFIQYIFTNIFTSNFKTICAGFQFKLPHTNIYCITNVGAQWQNVASKMLEKSGWIMRSKDSKIEAKIWTYLVIAQWDFFHKNRPRSISHTQGILVTCKISHESLGLGPIGKVWA